MQTGKPSIVVAVNTRIIHLILTNMKAIYKIFMPFVFVALLSGSCAAQSHVLVDVRFPMPAVPTIIIAPPPPPPFPGAIWMGGGHVWQGGRYVYESPRYVHPYEARKWKKAVKHHHYKVYAHEKKHHHYKVYACEKKHHHKKHRRH